MSLTRLALLIVTASTLASATDADNRALYALLQGNASASEQAAAVHKQFNTKQLKEGSATATYLGEFVWAIESASKPELIVDDLPPVAMKSLPGNLWILTQHVTIGRSHAFYYRNATDPAAVTRRDISAFTEDSYPKDGVAKGKLSEMSVLTSTVYRGHKLSYWIYAAAGVDPNVPAPVMIWQDGQGFASPRSRFSTVIDNLTAQKKIPPMVILMIAPGVVKEDNTIVPDSPTMRSIYYDTVDDNYNKMVFGELFPEVQKQYKLRTDGYSVGAGGQSSGGICAFNMAWWRPGEVSRVMSRIGSFTAIQWHHGQENSKHRWGLDDTANFTDGGYIFPFMVRERERKNIRVWLDDGSNDLENAFGSWPLQNIQLANSLKMKEYDFHFSFGNQQHSTTNGDAELPMSMAWLWRDYDPAKTVADYQMDPAEKAKPMFRVTITNR